MIGVIFWGGDGGGKHFFWEENLPWVSPPPSQSYILAPIFHQLKKTKPKLFPETYILCTWIILVSQWWSNSGNREITWPNQKYNFVVVVVVVVVAVVFRKKKIWVGNPRAPIKK